MKPYKMDIGCCGHCGQLCDTDTHVQYGNASKQLIFLGTHHLQSLDLIQNTQHKASHTMEPTNSFKLTNRLYDSTQPHNEKAVQPNPMTKYGVIYETLVSVSMLFHS